tara:strand:- start:1087 stop:1455 length:369 start_codon:yes stop_codon:yes gene_type:complete
MKKLLITLLLISPFSFADWGDVYYCQMTTNASTNLDGKRTDYLLEKFQFKLDKAKQAMVFGGKGYFSGTEAKLSPNKQWPLLEAWYAASEYATYVYADGQFVYAYMGLARGLSAVSADCDKF